MKQLTSTVSGIGYRRVIKPVLFRVDPDKVHQRTVGMGARAQSSPTFSRLIKNNWAYQNEPKLGQTVDGIYFPNPVGLSAGFDKNFELISLMKSIGFGFMEGGSLTYHDCPGNPKPWFYRLPKSKSLVVHVGLANRGAVRALDRVKAYKSTSFDNFPLNISVAKTNSPAVVSEERAVADYIGSLKLIKSAEVGQVITLNISCPNAFGGEPFTTPAKMDRLLSAVDDLSLSQPIFVKMPSDLDEPDFDALLEVISGHVISGVTIGNLAKNRDKLKLNDRLPTGVKGNLSGRPTWQLSNNHIARTYRRYHDRLTIIGVGGIFTAEDAYTKIRLGASLVELITALIFEGPQLIGQINRGLCELLKRDKFSNISEAIGLDTKIQSPVD